MSSSVQLDVRPLDDYDKKVAKEQLRETPTVKDDAIKELRRLLNADKNLYYDDSDEFLTMILRPVKFYSQSGYDLLRRIADFRQKNATILENVSPLAEKDSFLNTKVLNVLIDRDQHRRRILTMCMGSLWKPSILNTDKLFRVLYLIHFGALMEPKTQIHGTIIIMDFSGLSYSQATAFGPTFSRRLLTFIQDAMPLRLKAVHIIFQPLIFKLVWNIFQTFIRPKLRKRIFFHNSDVSSLHKHVDPSCLPAKYGGTKGEIDYGSADWFPVLAQHEDTIKEWHSYGYQKDCDKL